MLNYNKISIGIMLQTLLLITPTLNAEGEQEQLSVVEEAAPAAVVDSVPVEPKDHQQELLEAVQAQREYLLKNRYNRQMPESLQQQHEQMQQRIAQQQQFLRANRWWRNPHGEYLNALHAQRRAAMQKYAQEQRERMEQQRSEQRPISPPYGWNNPWYYRGY